MHHQAQKGFHGIFVGFPQHQKQHHTKILSSVCVVFKDAIFDAVEIQQRYRENPVVLGDAWLITLYKYTQYIFVQRMDKIKHVNTILKVSYLLQV